MATPSLRKPPPPPHPFHRPLSFCNSLNTLHFFVLSLDTWYNRLQTSEKSLAEAREAVERMEASSFESSRRAQEAEAAWEVEREILSQSNEASQVKGRVSLDERGGGEGEIGRRDSFRVFFFCFFLFFFFFSTPWRLAVCGVARASSHLSTLLPVCFIIPDLMCKRRLRGGVYLMKVGGEVYLMKVEGGGYIL